MASPSASLQAAESGAGSFPPRRRRELCFLGEGVTEGAMALESQVENFLQECERSGDAAYAALKVVLERLQAPVTRSEARRFLAFVHRHFDSREAADACSAQYHFRMHDVLIGDFEVWFAL
ncbi:hypothetical protein HPP92_001750 [Vanilla planifolia]|uniref:Uncharacterized protein n=1 Tax=Vanilla planifolia TaxID=51239 RepID=A0A835SDC4_VANPL|nr:hypothetical protein HPP92_001750 [Vanilla planifolia]